MKKLTLKMLKKMKPDTIFASGTATIDTEDCLHPDSTGNGLRWAAARGKICDWVIYYCWASNFFEAFSSIKRDRWIVKYGIKIRDNGYIKTLVPCDDEAFKMYRY